MREKVFRAVHINRLHYQNSISPRFLVLTSCNSLRREREVTMATGGLFEIDG